MRAHLRLLVAMSLAAVALGGGATLTSAAAVSNPTVYAVIGGCFSGELPADSTDVDVTWKRKNGTVQKSFNTSAPDSRWAASIFDCLAPNGIRVGDTIRVVDNDHSLSRTFTVKNVLGTFNRETNVVAGNAPPSGTLKLAVQRVGLLNTTLEIGQACHLNVAKAVDGSFSRNVLHCRPGYDPMGGDRARLTWHSPNGDSVTRDIYAPFVGPTIKSSLINGVAYLGASVNLSLRKPTGTVRGSTSTVASKLDGRYFAQFLSAGQPAEVHRNDVIRGNWQGSQSYTVLALTIQGNAGDHSVSGHCLPHMRFHITSSAGLDAFFQGYGKTDANGNVSMDLAGSTLRSGDVIGLACADVNGDRTVQYRTVP